MAMRVRFTEHLRSCHVRFEGTSFEAGSQVKLHLQGLEGEVFSMVSRTLSGMFRSIHA